MVRAKVVLNAQTKQYDWKILDEKDEDLFEIETPWHNRLFLRNLNLPTDSRAVVVGTVAHLELPAEIVEQFVKAITGYPLLSFFHVNTERLSTIRIFHPVKDRTIDVEEDLLVRALIAVHNDILIQIFEFDDKKRKLACLEHSATRVQLADEFAELNK